MPRQHGVTSQFKLNGRFSTSTWATLYVLLKLKYAFPFLISGGDLLDHFLSDDCGLRPRPPECLGGAETGTAPAAAAVSPDDDSAETGSVIEDSVEAAAVKVYSTHILECESSFISSYFFLIFEKLNIMHHP